VHTITGDNGKVSAEHNRIAQDLCIDLFFAHPYTVWERDTNENMHGLVRQ
jgi:IS30 family transposase